MACNGEYVELSPNVFACVCDYVNPDGSPQSPQLGPGKVLYLRFNRFNPVPMEDARGPWYLSLYPEELEKLAALLKEAGF